MPITIPLSDVELTAVRAQGPGGQNVNKVSSAVHLRFDIARSSLPQAVKERLLASGDQRITREGVVVIKAQTARTRGQNQAEALARLQAMVADASRVRAVRRATQPTLASRRRRREGKALRAGVKAQRSKVVVP